MKAALGILIVTLLLSLFLVSSNAFAVGFGVFVDVSGGEGEAEWDSDFDSWDIESNTQAGGFVMDTSPTDQSFFNYRLNVGFAGQEIEDDEGVTMESGGIYVENIFGFSPVRNQNFRWWLGPLIRVGYYSGDADSLDENIKLDIEYAEFALGAVTGLNFKAGRIVLSPSFGVRFSGLAGTGEYEYRNYYYGTYSEEEDIEGTMTTAFANFAVLF